MRRRSLLVAVWLAGTVAATTLAWAAVGQVTAEVGPEPPLPLPSEIAFAPDAAPRQAASEPAEEASPSQAPRSDRPRRTERPQGTGGRPGAQQPDAAPAEEVDDPEDGQAAAPPAAQEGDETPEQSEPADPQPATTESYSLSGGVVTIRYSGGAAQLLGASPASGFTVEVNDAGPPHVDVRFRSDEHESRLRAEWRNGRPDVRREEDER